MKIALRISSLLIFISLAFPASAQLAPLTNNLKNHPAPYLALHGDDPVAWQDWQASVMERARIDNRIVLISVGYFACHWCHVMQQESYQDKEVAQILNRHFVSVKIDRELEPALDSRLMDFAQATIGRGGWPLNVFVTPEGHPIYAMLYAPRAQFLETLNRLQTFWNADPDKIRRLVVEQRTPTVPRSSGDINKQAMQAVIDAAPAKMLARADTLNGGFGSTSKFPSVVQMAFLLDRYQQYNDSEIGEFILKTLDAMAYQGINDHLSGGFFRYSVDPRWAIPHFEKMLYDNATLAELYIDAGNVFGRDDYHRVARDTLDFMQDAMWIEKGFVASFSAVDDDSIEGGHYLWQSDALVELLTPAEFTVVAAIWGLDQPAKLEAGNQPRYLQTVEALATRSGDSPQEIQALLDQATEKMLVARSRRSLPVDDKILAGWNGLALSAFAKAWQQYDDPTYRVTAQNLAELLSSALWNGKEVTRALARGQPRGSAALEDYAYVSTGLLDWSEASGNEAAATTAEDIVRRAWTLFYRNNAWFEEDGSLLLPPVGTDLMEDGPTASASAQLIATSYRIARRQDDRDWLETIRAVVNRGEEQMTRGPYWFVSQMAALQLVLNDL